MNMNMNGEEEKTLHDVQTFNHTIITIRTEGRYTMFVRRQKWKGGRVGREEETSPLHACSNG